MIPVPSIPAGKTSDMSVDTVLNRPMSTGSVYLRDSDPHSQPKIDGRWLSHPDDVDTQVSKSRHSLLPWGC